MDYCDLKRSRRILSLAGIGACSSEPCRASCIASRTRRGASVSKGYDTSKRGVERIRRPNRVGAGKEIITVYPTCFVTPELIKDTDIPERGILANTLRRQRRERGSVRALSPGKSFRRTPHRCRLRCISSKVRPTSLSGQIPRQ